MSKEISILLDENYALQAKVEELTANSVHGWRSCIDHIIRPDSPCPVCKVEELTEWNGISIGLKCPACDDVGWYVAFSGEQEQCEFCYTCPDSIFNRKAALKEEDEK